MHESVPRTLEVAYLPPNYELEEDSNENPEGEE